MPNKNNILNSSFLDFQVFALEEVQNLQKLASGENKKGVFIHIFNQEDRPELVFFLEKIMGAVHHNLKEDVLFLSSEKQTNYNISDLSRKATIQKAIFFGQTPKSVGLNIQVQKYALLNLGGKQFLFADDLAVIHDDRKLKKALWLCLKEIFGV